MSADDSKDSSLPASVERFAADLGVLIRSEFESARREMVEKAKAAGVGAGMLSASAVGALFTLACLTALLIAALSLALPVWLAALIVTVLWAAATAALALFGKKKVQDAGPFIPEQTIADVKEDLQWARSRVPPSRR
ncbi:MAG: phage holin family protein [Candidatus Eremiobacteraeota bacterium]|nr:phage holin family protein [Candidatus Eremiobacteraeota bacterium]